MKLTLETVYELMDKMVATGLGEVEIADGETKLKIKAKAEPPVTMNMGQSGGERVHSMELLMSDPSLKQESVLPGNVVKSPIVGTFYAASAPDKDPFVQPGDTVKKGDVLFIVESMKLMNEVTSDYDGTVLQLLVENGQPVEFGQPVMVIK